MGLTLSETIWRTIQLPPSETHVLVCLAMFGNGDGTQIFPGIDTIAIRTNYSRKQVKRILASLRRRGILRVVGKNAQYGTIEYRIVLNGAPQKITRRKSKKATADNMSISGDIVGSAPWPICPEKSGQDGPLPRTNDLPKILDVPAEEENTSEKFAEVKNATISLQKACTGRTVWDVPSTAALQKLLRIHSSWPAQDLVRCLIHRFLSPGRSATQSPSKYLLSITDFFQGPIDRYNQLIAASNDSLRQLTNAAGLRGAGFLQTSAPDQETAFAERRHVVRGRARDAGWVTDFDKTIWQEFLQQLAGEIPRHTFDNWVRSVKPAFSDPSGTVFVIVATDGQVAMLNKYNAAFQIAVRDVGLTTAVRVISIAEAERLVQHG